MKWKLWVDDDLNNPIAPERHTPPGFIGCETAEEAIELVKKHGFANLQFMDLDHDLGVYPDGSIRDVKKFVKWLTETYEDGPVPSYSVHSKNPPGKEWTESYLDSWKRSLEFLPLPHPKKDSQGYTIPYRVAYGLNGSILEVTRVADTYVMAYWKGAHLQFSRKYITAILPAEVKENLYRDSPYFAEQGTR